MSILLFVMIFIDAFHPLNEIATIIPNNFHKIILMEIIYIRDPERKILCAGGILAKGKELCNLSTFKLAHESLVLTPEESYIWNLKELHSKSFQSNAKGPSNLIFVLATILHNSLMKDATT